MTKETKYAHALRALVGENPAKAKEYIENMHKLLVRRKEQKLLPRILSAYQKLDEGEQRAQEYRTVTPQDARNRTLVELYRTLIASH